jgi:hypothetical protein
MPEYEFFVAEGPKGKFQASNKAIRSHAMKTALQTRSQQAGSKDQPASLADSRDTVRHRAELKRRFRLPGLRRVKETGTAAAEDHVDRHAAKKRLAHSQDAQV